LERWYVCVLHREFNGSLARTVDGRIMRHGIISRPEIFSSSHHC